ncbi:AAA family ATPase [Caproiciproducens faecalis]|uniref:MoxR family ATPase n=1 Tax=Caproiciproducens faecalis TaxID=2820301 RepID=A0ABS7DKE6_9FIRM|nr:MoxR family ATPase [Caproiciproducens faecalis]MBW7571688.1 MoxR family ATPase [Caproiciproducens faecalis]
MQEKAARIINEVKKAVVGKDVIIRKVLMVILAQGHILLEDIPGVGKTTLALAFSKAMSLDYKRVQFTPDVMPTDVTGFSIYNKATGSLEYKPGAALCNLFLADEINRTSSKTQSALLEVMEEGSITVDGTTHPTPKPYIVIATQNPIGSVGTQMLPDSQLDRFMVRLTMGYPELSDEIEILKRKQGDDPLESVQKAADAREILAMQNETDTVYLSNDLYGYIARLVSATRENSLIRLGASPRGSIALVKMAQASAYLSGRDYVVPKDVQSVFADVVEHRIILKPQAKIGNVTAAGLLRDILRDVPAPAVAQK